MSAGSTLRTVLAITSTCWKKVPMTMIAILGASSMPRIATHSAAKAGAGEILVPETVRGLLSGKTFLFSDRGKFVPKNFEDAVRLWDVRWRE